MRESCWGAFISCIACDNFFHPLSLHVFIFQSRGSFLNLFQPEMKLELKHQTDEASYCIATVVNVCGPRLHLLLDGCSHSDDVWLLCDSSEIHPIGWCKEKGLNLKQPEGSLSVFIKLQSSLKRFPIRLC